MISRRILAAVALLCALCAPAWAQKTKATIDAEINTLFPDNTQYQITPFDLRSVTSDIVNSIMPTAPVVAGNSACFSGATGLLQDCGSAPGLYLPLAGGTMSGNIAMGGNQINNVVIGASNPLAGSFTTLVAETTGPAAISATDGATYTLQIGGTSSTAQIGGASGTTALAFKTNGSETARLQTGFSVGSTTDPGAGAISANTTVAATTGFKLGANPLVSSTAPVATTFCATSPSISANNGTAAFTINVGTSCSTSVGTITMPSATTGWVCHFADVTTPASNIPRQTGGTQTTVTLTNYAATTGLASNWTASEVLRAMCTAY